MKRLLATSLILYCFACKHGNAQGEFFETGQSGSVLAGTFGGDFESNFYMYGAEVGYSIQGRFDLGAGISRAKTVGARTSRPLGTVVSGTATVHVVKYARFGIAALGSLSKDIEDDSGANASLIGLEFYGSLEAERGPQVVPQITIGRIATTVWRPKRYRFIDSPIVQFKEAHMVISAGLSLTGLRNKRDTNPVFGLAVSHTDGTTTGIVYLGLLFAPD